MIARRPITSSSMKHTLTIFALLVTTSSAFAFPTAFSARTLSSSSSSHHPLNSAAASIDLSTINGSSNGNPVADSHNDSNSPQIRLNVNEKARTVTSVCTSGTLCTLSSHPDIDGAPFGSLVDYVLDDNGCPVLLMNERSMHTMNIQAAMEQHSQDSPRALVTLFTQLGSSSSPNNNSNNSNNNGMDKNEVLQQQDVSRCSMTGRLEKIPSTSPDMDAIRLRYSLAHVYADQVMDSSKFAFYRLLPQTIYFVGGFGVLAKWVDPADYQLAAPDILAKEASEIVSKINKEHMDDLELTAQHVLKVEETVERIRVTNVDRLGMDVRVTTQAGRRRNKLETNEFRIGFRIPVVSVEDAKSEILKVFQDAWESANGCTWGEGPEASSVPFVKIAADGLE